MENVTEAQVSNLFNNLNTNRSSIGIPNKLIKIAAEPLSVLFMQIYNQSIETGIVPNILKVHSLLQFTNVVMQLTQPTIGLFQLSRLLVRFLKS